jgi:hypothetical protein
MTLQNRVTPLGELVAEPGRGLVYGNRGCLHDASGRIRRRYSGKRWIACRLQFRGRQRSPLMQPGRFTELFFLDEATAFGAGHHRGHVGADAIDAQLHTERVDPETRAQLRHEAPIDELPDGAFVLQEKAPCLVLGSELLVWTAAGYATRVPRPERELAVLITPPSLVAILRADWQPLVPLLHPSALGAGA